MSDPLEKLRNDYTELLKARAAWIEAERRLARAEDEARLALTKLVVSRDQLRFDAGEIYEFAEEGESVEALLGEEFLKDQMDDDTPSPDRLLHSIAYQGIPLGEACRRALEDAQRDPLIQFPAPGGPTTEELVEILSSGGFGFASDSPAREVHGALIKQPWVRRDKDSGRWRLMGRGEGA